MNQDQYIKELAILIAIGKLYSEQATTLTGHLKQKQKFVFNLSVTSIDTFVKEIEKLLPEQANKIIENIVDEFHIALYEVRK